jgi:hypothetical protein
MIAARWAIPVAYVIPKRVLEGLISAEIARTQALAGARHGDVRAHPVGGSGKGALPPSYVAQQKLLVSRLRLGGIVQSAMEFIITVDGQRKIV